jgi:hypothetical protein
MDEQGCSSNFQNPYPNPPSASNNYSGNGNRQPLEDSLKSFIEA